MHLVKKQKLSNLFKNRIRSYSAQAAAVTAAVHLLLIVFAGSVVAVRYVQKQNAQLTAGTESRPRLERRKLQSPARIEQLQKRALTSRIVSKKVSFSNPEFVFPDTGTPGVLKTQKSGLPGFDAGRALRNLSRSPGIRPSYINFFGIRGESEKAVFIIDASSAMLDSSTGGAAAYEYIKNELVRITSELNPAVLFNLILYDGQRVSLFRSQLVPAAKENTAALAAWIQEINSDPARPGLPEERNNYRRPEEPYKTAVGADASCWLLALQAAFEQKADSIFLLCADWGSHSISPEKRRLLRDFSLWELLSGGGQVSVRGSPVLRDDRKLRDDLLKQAVEAIRKDEESRKKAGLPSEFLHDIPAYIQYPADQILDHAAAVCRARYVSGPQVHVVRLIAEGEGGKSDYCAVNMRDLVRKYKGEFGVFSSEQALRKQKTFAQFDDSKPSSSSAEIKPPEIPVSTVKLLGIEAPGSKVVFVLDASAGMLSPKTGGTNTYALIKQNIVRAVSQLQSGTLFNVIAYDGRQVALFRSRMTAAPGDKELAEWLAGLNSNAARPGLTPAQNNYTPLRTYETALGADAQSLPYALQAALEEQADTIFIISAGIGPQPVSLEKAIRLLDFSVWNSLGGASGNPEEEDESGNPVSGSGTAAASGGQLQALQQDRRMYAALLKQTLDRIAAEKKARQDAGLPPGFVPDILNSIEYPRGQVLGHISAVGNFNYVSQGLDMPVIHFICLQEEAARPAKETVRDLAGLTKPCNGTTRFFQASDTAE